jgi:hypothetical protein
MVKTMEMKIMWETACQKLHHDWGWLKYVKIPPIKMVMTWGWFMQVGLPHEQTILVQHGHDADDAVAPRVAISTFLHTWPGHEQCTCSSPFWERGKGETHDRMTVFKKTMGNHGNKESMLGGPTKNYRTLRLCFSGWPLELCVSTLTSKHHRETRWTSRETNVKKNTETLQGDAP